MNSETPLTDAEAYDYTPARTEADEFYGNTPEAREVVNADFARRLELRNRRLVQALRGLLSFSESMPCYNFDKMQPVIDARVALDDQQEEKPEMDYIPPGAPSDFNED